MYTIHYIPHEVGEHACVGCQAGNCDAAMVVDLEELLVVPVGRLIVGVESLYTSLRTQQQDNAFAFPPVMGWCTLLMCTYSEKEKYIAKSWCCRFLNAARIACVLLRRPNTIVPWLTAFEFL